MWSPFVIYVTTIAKTMGWTTRTTKTAAAEAVLRNSMPKYFFKVLSIEKAFGTFGMK